MIGFILIYIFIAVAYSLSRLLNLDEGKKSFVILFPTALISSTIVGLRPVDAGFDTDVYISYLNSLKNESLFTFNQVDAYNFESAYLFKFWNYIFAYLDLGDSFFLYCTAFTSIFIFLLVLKKMFTKDYLLLFLFFLCSPAFVSLFGNAIRQGFAISFFLLSVYYFFEKKYIKLLLFFLVTIFFHTYTGVILFVTLLLLILFSKGMRKYKFLLFIILLAIEPASFFVSKFLVDFFNIFYFEFISTTYFFHYSFILFLSLYVIYNFLLKVDNEKLNKYFLAYVVITALTSIVWFNPDTFGRILYLGYPFLFFFIVELATLYRQKWLPILMILIMFFVGIYFFNQPSTMITLSSSRNR